MKLRSPSCLSITITLSAAILVITIWDLRRPNPLKEYGFSYQIYNGASDSYQIIDLRKIPETEPRSYLHTSGSLLYLKFEDRDDDNIPEIVIRSKSYKTYEAVVKIHPEKVGHAYFEILKEKGIGFGHS